MFREHAGDVIVDHDNVIDLAVPLLANMPMVAEPQPTRIRSSVTPLMMGDTGCTTNGRPPSIMISTACSCSNPSACRQVTRLLSSSRRSGDARRQARAFASRIRRS